MGTIRVLLMVLALNASADSFILNTQEIYHYACKPYEVTLWYMDELHFDKRGEKTRIFSFDRTVEGVRLYYKDNSMAALFHNQGVWYVILDGYKIRCFSLQ